VKRRFFREKNGKTVLLWHDGVKIYADGTCIAPSESPFLLEWKILHGELFSIERIGFYRDEDTMFMRALKMSLKELVDYNMDCLLEEQG
jgi:hypothetical protein